MPLIFAHWRACSRCPQQLKLQFVCLFVYVFQMCRTFIQKQHPSPSCLRILHCCSYVQRHVSTSKGSLALQRGGLSFAPEGLTEFPLYGTGLVSSLSLSFTFIPFFLFLLCFSSLRRSLFFFEEGAMIPIPLTSPDLCSQTLGLLVSLLYPPSLFSPFPLSSGKIPQSNLAAQSSLAVPFFFSYLCWMVIVSTF